MSRSLLKGHPSMMRHNPHQEATYLGAGSWSIMGATYRSDVTVIGVNSLGPGKPTVGRTYPCVFRDPSYWRHPLVFVPFVTKAHRDPLSLEGIVGEWQTYMQNQLRSGVGGEEYGDYTIETNTWQSVINGSNNGVYMLRIREGWIYCTKRTGSGTAQIDTIGRYAKGFLTTPTHTSARPGPVLDMAFDPVSGDLFIVEMEDTFNFQHESYSRYHDPTGNGFGGPQFDAPTSDYYGNWPTTTFQPPTRSRLVRLSADTLTELWVSAWHSAGTFCGCALYAYANPASVLGGYPHRGDGGNIIHFLGSKVVVTGKRTTGSNLFMSPHMWTFDNDVEASTSSSGAIRLPFETPPHVELGTWWDDLPEFGYNGDADFGMLNYSRYRFSSGPQFGGHWYGNGTAAPSPAGNAYRPGTGRVVRGSSVVIRADDGHLGGYEWGNVRAWYTFPRRGVIVPSIVSIPTEPTTTGNPTHSIYRGVSQICGFTSTGTRAWIKRGWDEEGFRETYVPIYAARNGRLLVRTVRERYLDLSEPWAATGDITPDPEDPYWVGRIIDHMEIFYDVYRVSAGSLSLLSRGKLSNQQTRTSLAYRPIGEPITNFNTTIKPHMGGIAGLGAGSPAINLNTDNVFFGGGGTQMSTSLNVTFDVPDLPHDQLNVFSTPDETQLIFLPVWHANVGDGTKHRKVSYGTADGVTVESLTDCDMGTAVQVVSYDWSRNELWRNTISTVGAAKVTFANFYAYSNTRGLLHYRKDNIGYFRLIALTDHEVPAVDPEEEPTEYEAGQTIDEWSNNVLTNTPFSTTHIPHEHPTAELLIGGEDFLLTIDRSTVITLQPTV